MEAPQHISLEDEIPIAKFSILGFYIPIFGTFGVENPK